MILEALPTARNHNKVRLDLCQKLPDGQDGPLPKKLTVVIFKASFLPLKEQKGLIEFQDPVTPDIPAVFCLVKAEFTPLFCFFEILLVFVFTGF
jgi:hypothetical protein